jgi:hypothetical protein
MKDLATEAPFYLHNDPHFSELQAPWFTHEYINYFAAMGSTWLQSIPKVPVQLNPQFIGIPVGPEHTDLYRESPLPNENNHEHLGYDCEIRKGHFPDMPPASAEIDPWQICVLYASEPDWHLDCGLDLHWKQKLTKGSHGYRHMQFKLLGHRFGTTEITFQQYIDAARKAFEANNAYWGWRYISRSTHYLADLGHPFHVKVAPNRELLKLLVNFKNGFKIMTSMHNGHEVYTQYRLRSGFFPFKKAIIEGVQNGERDPESVLSKIYHYRKTSEKLQTPLYNAFKAGFGKQLFNVYNFSDDPNIDTSKLTFDCEREAEKVIFANPEQPDLATVDQITTRLLYNVGEMIGSLWRFIRQQMKIGQ